MKNKILEKNGKKWLNKYYESDDYIVLNISKEETTESYNVLIDKEDFQIVSQRQWCVKFRILKNNEKFYSVCCRMTDLGYTFLHQLLLKGYDSSNYIIDHINRNRFDNRKVNLRITSQSVNVKNKDYKGYNFSKKTNKYIVRLSIGNERIHLGSYANEQDAEVIYLKACIIGKIDDISHNIKKRIDKLNITIEDADYNNFYLKRVVDYINNGNLRRIQNSKDNYMENIDIIIKLKETKMSWNNIANYLKLNNIISPCNVNTLRKYYNEYGINKILLKN